MKYTVLIIKNKDVLNGEDFNKEDVYAIMDGELLLLGVGKKRKTEDVIDIQSVSIGDYRDLARINMNMVNRTYTEWLKKQDEVNE